ncbi:MAG: ADP-ribosylglycohydrolase family protein [Chthoniobacterales bacterium]
MAGWTTLRELVREEFKQSLEEGKDPGKVDALRPAYEAASEDEDALAKVHRQLLALPVRDDFPFEEPSGLDSIRALRTNDQRTWELSIDDDQLYDKLYGAWLGRCAGCALGKPAEQLMTRLQLAHIGNSWELQKKYLVAVSADEWPIRDYFPAHSPAEPETGPLDWGKGSFRETIAHMETDDDIRYTVLGQQILTDYGRDFRSCNVANRWLGLGYTFFCTAETQAYRNYVIRGDGFRNPAREPDLDQTADWEFYTHHQNPYREWIGAQIRVDSYAYAAPGNPQLAAEYAWRDARISHVKNGIYSAMFCSAIIAAAFATSDVHEIIAAGLAEIPATSRLHAELLQTIAICKKYECNFEHFEAVFTELHALLGHYHYVHSNNNTALCVVALLLSNGDFHQGITLAVMGGWDTDCNGATVGSVVGAITGAKLAPKLWVDRLNDTLRAGLLGYDPIAISECARRSLHIARKD